MKIYNIQKNSILDPVAYTSLSELCKAHKLQYSAVSKGKRIIIKGADVYRITETTVQKIKGRGNKQL